MRKGSRGVQAQRSRCGPARGLRPGPLLALGLVVAGLLAPAASGARQAERSGASFCSSKAVRKDPNAKFKVRLAISSRTVSPGGTVRIRIENPGAVDAAYGYPYQLQRRERNSWVNLPVGPFFSARLTVRSGRAGICQKIHLAKSAAPGTYRVSKSAWPAAAKDERPRVVVRATFRVLVGDPHRWLWGHQQSAGRVVS